MRKRAKALRGRPLAYGAGVVCACILQWAPVAHAEIDEPLTRVSDVTETTATQWESFGFRLQLRLGYQDWAGLQGVPSGGGFNLNLEPACQLTSAWSLGLDLDYTILMFAMSGIRLSLGLAPTWHPIDNLQVGLALGYAAMLASWAYDTPTNGAGLAQSGNCDGQGVLGKLRVAYMFEMSDNWSTGPSVSAAIAWVHCRLVSSTSIDTNVYSAPWLAPWWQYDFNATWAFTWR
jgi:hypothetical protein